MSVFLTGVEFRLTSLQSELALSYAVVKLGDPLGIALKKRVSPYDLFIWAKSGDKQLQPVNECSQHGLGHVEILITAICKKTPDVEITKQV